MASTESFSFDIFLSHSSKDKVFVRAIAEKLRDDGFRVWFDEWEIKPGDNIPAKIDEGLENSKKLALFMSENAFGSDWTTLEGGTFRFRDPLNKDRRFIPLRVDDSPIKDSLSQFRYIDLRSGKIDYGYEELLDVCSSPVRKKITSSGCIGDDHTQRVFQLPIEATFFGYAYFGNGRKLIFSTHPMHKQPKQGPEIEYAIRLWDLNENRCIRLFTGNTDISENIVLSPDEKYIISGSFDKAVRLWEVISGDCLRVFHGHTEQVWDVKWSYDQRYILSSSYDKSIRLWDVASGQCVQIFEGHKNRVRQVEWSRDQKRVLSCGDDNSIRLWDVRTGECLMILEGHEKWVLSVAWSKDEKFILSGSCDRSMILWEIATGNSMRVFNGHTANVDNIVWSPDQRFAITASPDKTLRLWKVDTGNCVKIFEGHNSPIKKIHWKSDQRWVISSDMSGRVRIWDLAEFIEE